MTTGMSEGFRLSFQQRRLFFLGAGGARAVGMMEVPPGVAPETLRAAVAEAVARHEILRTFFVSSPGIKVPLQVIAEAADFEWSEEEGDPGAVFERERGRVGDLERGARLRAVLVGRVLVLSLPGLCGDAATLRRLAAELEALVAGQELEEASQYVDAAEWQRERFESDDEEAELGRSHWRRQSSDFRFPTLPFERAAGSSPLTQPPPPRGEGPTVPLELPSERLCSAAREHNLTPADLLRAAWWLTLRRLSGDTGEVRTAVAEPFEDDALEGVLGPLSRWIPLQATLDDDLRFHQAAAQLARLREEAAGWPRWYEPPGGDEPSVWPCGFEHGTGKGAGPEPVRLLLSVHESGDSLSATLSCDPGRYAADDVQTLAAAFLHLLDAALVDPAARVGELALAAFGTGASLHAEAAASDLQPVHRQIEAAARQNPQAPAVTVEDRTISYEELDSASNRLARALRSRGFVTRPDVPVALYLERSPELVIALLGILKAGGAYVPIDTSQPARRLAVMAEEVRPAVVLTQSSLAPNLPPEVPRILLDAEILALTSEPAAPLEDWALPESLAYVIFTSGSTGRPKGVGVEHRQLSAYVDGVSRRLDFQPGWSWASVSTVAADLGHTAVFPCLSTGGHLHLISQERASDAEALAEYFGRHPVDGLKIVPTHLEALAATAHPERVLPRRRLVLGGEASRGPWAQELRRRASAAGSALRVFNHYGPTETTVGALTFPLDAPLDPRQPTVPIGRPLPGAAVHLLDSQGRPVAPWEPGEVHLGGVQVSRGYLGRPDLTAERFVPDPFSGEPGARLYRTGDLARLIPHPDGDAIEFLGRRDHQVKYHGFRVELNEVRAALTSHPQVREGVVQLARDAAGHDALIAYYVSRQEIDPAELRELLSQTLIEEVVPNLFVHLRKLPLTLNGKINFRALPGLDEVRSLAARAFVAPRTETEEAVAKVWSEVLGIEKVSVEANFFELGGHSLLATRIISRLRESRGAEVPLRALFETPTVAALARRIDEQGPAAAPGAAPSRIPAAIPASATSIEDQLAELEGLGE